MTGFDGPARLHRLSDGNFQTLAFTDVGIGAHHAHSLSGPIAFGHLATPQNPDPMTVLVPDAVFQYQQIGDTFEYILGRLLQARIVVGVQMLHQPVVAEDDFAWLVTQHGVHAFVHEKTPGSDVPVPQCQAAAVKRQTQLLVVAGKQTGRRHARPRRPVLRFECVGGHVADSDGPNLTRREENTLTIVKLPCCKTRIFLSP